MGSGLLDAVIERVMTGPRWREAGYRWEAGDDDGRVTDAAGDVCVRVRYEPETKGHTIERYAGGQLAKRTRFEEHGRVRG
jgi:hypothetical protein